MGAYDPFSAKLAALKISDPARYEFAQRYKAGFVRAQFAEYRGDRGGNVSNLNEQIAFAASPQGKLSSSLTAEGFAKGYIKNNDSWLQKFETQIFQPLVKAIVVIGIGYGGYMAAAEAGGGSAAAQSGGVSGSGLGGASGTVGGAAAPGAASTVAVTSESAIPASSAGIWEGVKEYAGAVKKGTEIVGAVASTYTIVDSLTGKTKKITNSQKVPPGWVIQTGTPAQARQSVQDSGAAPASGSQWLPFAIVAAVLIGAR